MPVELEALARRAVACKRWRWMPGMIALDGCRVVCVYSDGYVYSNGESDGYQELAETDCSIPDLTDPATLGCLLALVREVWGDGVHLIADGGWYVKGARLKNGSTINLGICTKTEAGALVAALEGAR
jgi:hypothetical protein